MLVENPVLCVVMILISIGFLLFIAQQIKRNKLLIRYSLLWMLLSVLILVIAVFPQPVFELARALGFNVESNFIFFVAGFFLLVVCVMQSRAISQQTIKIKQIAQRQAILEKELTDVGSSVDQIEQVHSKQG